MKNKLSNMIQILVDTCILVVSYLLAYYLRFFVMGNLVDIFKVGANERWYTLNDYIDKFVFMIPVYLVIYYFLNLYTSMYNKRHLTVILRIVLANILGIVIFVSALYYFGALDISRKFIILFLIINIILCIGSRMLYSYYLKNMRKKHQLVS